MIDSTIILPTKPKIISEDKLRGTYEIEGLYPGYGHTLGNSLRRIILSSLSGTAITSVKITGAEHEFSTLPGVKEDGIMIILALKKVRFRLDGSGPERVTLSAKGVGEVTAKDIKAGSQVEILNPELVIASLTDKKATLEIEMTVEKGLGYLPKAAVRRDRNEVGVIFLDAVFTPIRQVSYEVENMRVGDRTNYNRLRLHIETDGTLHPHQALEQSINLMISQLQALVGFQESRSDKVAGLTSAAAATDGEPVDILKRKIEDLDLPSRTIKALTGGGVKTVAGLLKKKASDLGELEGLGDKSLKEISELLAQHNLALKE